MFPKFDSHTVWNRFMQKQDTLNLFMAVPTIYGIFHNKFRTNLKAKLIEDYDNMSESQQKIAKESCSKFRLMVSGSMALPGENTHKIFPNYYIESIMQKWKEISGHILLERYGMTGTKKKIYLFDIIL